MRCDKMGQDKIHAPSNLLPDQAASVPGAKWPVAAAKPNGAGLAVQATCGELRPQNTDFYRTDDTCPLLYSNSATSYIQLA